jgi:hypothetical protein
MCKSANDFSLQGAIQTLSTLIQRRTGPQSCSLNSLKNQRPNNHQDDDGFAKSHRKGESFDPSKGLLGADICSMQGLGQSEPARQLAPGLAAQRRW